VEPHILREIGFWLLSEGFGACLAALWIAGWILWGAGKCKSRTGAKGIALCWGALESGGFWPISRFFVLVK